MKAFLMHRDADVDLDSHRLPNEPDLAEDLELGTLLTSMAAGDRFLLDVARGALFTSLADPETIKYRQDVLRDCLRQPAVLSDLYDIAVEAIDAERKVYLGGLFRSPESTLHRSTKVLTSFVELLTRLRLIADEHADSFRSEGMTQFLRMLTKELDDKFFRDVEDHLHRLEFRNGVLISAALGATLTGEDYTLRRPHEDRRTWLERLTVKRPPSYTYTVPDRDEGGLRALSDLRGRGITLVADALEQSTAHILSFFQMMRTELGFYVACVNLHEELTARGNPTCFPVPLASQDPTLTCRGLYDPCLALRAEGPVSGNDVDAVSTSLVVVTGANQGGKSTFLRSVGVSQLMMQSGMFAPAESLESSLSRGVFTHYRREEDTTMTSGKLDEELSRMSTIADQAAAHSLVLCNESFAATNEREGSEISRQIILALIESGIRVVFVTHLYDLAHGLYLRQMDGALFLRAPRQPDGRRTFRLIEGEPLPTSFGKDVYDRVFRPAGTGTAPDAADLEPRE